MPIIFDPTQKDTEMKNATQVSDQKALGKKMFAFAIETVSARRARGCKDPEQVPVYHRLSDEVRWFNFSPKYQGMLNHAEACWTGSWRLATDDEERVELLRMARAKLGVAREKLAVDEAASIKTKVDDYQFREAVKTVALAEAKDSVEPKTKK